MQIHHSSVKTPNKRPLGPSYLQFSASFNATFKSPIWRKKYSIPRLPCRIARFCARHFAVLRTAVRLTSRVPHRNRTAARAARWSAPTTHAPVPHRNRTAARAAPEKRNAGEFARASLTRCLRQLCRPVVVRLRAHLRFSPMRFEIGNNHDNFQEQHYPADAP